VVGTPEHTELEVDSVISRQNVSKEGWTTYYVDGANGNDANNGLRWESALKTIQAAIDKAESWAKIYVKAGTYAESITLDKEHLKIIGESRSSVIIAPSSATHVVNITGDQCELHNLKIVFPTGTGATSAVRLASFKNTIENVWLHNDGDDGWGFLMGSGYDEQTIRNCKVTGFMNQMNIAGGIKHHIHDNDLILNGAGGVNIYVDSTSRCLIHDNYCDGGGAGTGIDSSNNSKNSYYHNNLLNHTDNASEDSANNLWRENFYDDGPLDIDNDGYGDSPYDVGNPAGTDYDYFPIAKVNGWKALHGGKGGVATAGYTGDIMILDSFAYISDAALQAEWHNDGEAGAPTLSTTSVFGEHSMEVAIGAGGTGSVYRNIKSCDFTVIANINFYARSNKAGGDTCRLYLYDSDGNYSYWDCAIATADTWEDININPASTPDGSSLTPPDLTDIVKIEFGNLTAGSTYLFDFIALESLVSSKVGLGYDGLDDAMETTSSVRGHLLLEGNRVGAGYDAADDTPREDGSVRGHLLFIQDHIEWHEIEDASDYNDTTVNPIKANKEYPILKIYCSGGTIYVYKYVWTTDQGGADPDLTTAQSLITSFDGDLFEVSKIFVTIKPSTINGLWDNMGATDKVYLFVRYYDGVSSDMKLVPPVVLRDKASDTLVSSPPVDTDLGETVVFDTEKVIQPTMLVVYFYVDNNIATRTYVPFTFSVRRAH